MVVLAAAMALSSAISALAAMDAMLSSSHARPGDAVLLLTDDHGGSGNYQGLASENHQPIYLAPTTGDLAHGCGGPGSQPVGRLEWRGNAGGLLFIVPSLPVADYWLFMLTSNQCWRIGATIGILVLSIGTSPADNQDAAARWTSDSLGPPTGSTSQQPSAKCTAADARQVVESFLDSFNRGDAQHLDQLVAGPGVFVWYSTDSPGQRANDDATNRSTLVGYFAMRHEHHERLELRYFRFNGISPTGLGNFEFELIRSTDDGLTSAPYGGKGALVCSRLPITLVVWSMAREPFLRSDLPNQLLVVGLLLVIFAGAGFALYRLRHVRHAPTRAQGR